MHHLACTCLNIIKTLFISTFHVMGVTLMELGIPVTASCMHCDTKLAMLLVYLL